LSDIKNSYNRLFESSEIKRIKSQIVEFGRVIALFSSFLLQTISKMQIAFKSKLNSAKSRFSWARTDEKAAHTWSM